MTDPQPQKATRLGELFVEVTGDTTIEENQCTPHRRVVADEDEQPAGEVSEYVARVTKSHGLEDALGDATDDGSE